MKKLLTDRRFLVSIFAISCLTLIGVQKGADVAAAISTVALAICAANSAEGIFKKEKNDDK